MVNRWSHTFTILGRPASWKNSMNVALRPSKDGKGQRCPCCSKRLATVPLHSKHAAHWMKNAITQLEAQWPYVSIAKNEAIDLELDVFFPTKAFADCTSILDAVQDALQRAGVIEDDVCIEPRACRRQKDASNPRVIATLTLSRERY